MNNFNHHIDVLPEDQRKLWTSLSHAKDLGFTLYGGTALALRLGHRESMDFDFFSDKELDENSSLLTDNIPFLKDALIIQKCKNTLSYETNNGVKLSFFGNINFGRVGDFELTNDNVVCVASIYDLFATKLAALFSRVTIKDYIDISELIMQGYQLEKGISAALSLYKDIPYQLVLESLVFFDDKSLNNLEIERKKILNQAVKIFDYNKVKPLPILSNNLGIDNSFDKEFKFTM